MPNATRSSRAKTAPPKTTKPRASRPEPATSLPDADLRPETVRRLADTLPAKLREQMERLGLEAKILAAVGLEATERYRDVWNAISNQLEPETERVDNGGDLLWAVIDETGAVGEGLKSFRDAVLGLTVGLTNELPDDAPIRALAADHDAPAASYCTCTFYGQHGEKQRAFHDDLLSFEDRGVPGAVWLIGQMHAHDEFDAEAWPLSALDLPEFVTQHNWRDPVAVSRLAEEVDTLRRFFNEGSGARAPIPERRPADTHAADVVRARRIEIVDEVGRTRVAIGDTDPDLIEQPISPGIAIYSATGHRGAWLTVDEDEPGLYLDHHGWLDCAVTATRDGGRVTVENEDGRERVTLTPGGLSGWPASRSHP